MQKSLLRVWMILKFTWSYYEIPLCGITLLNLWVKNISLEILSRFEPINIDNGGNYANHFAITVVYLLLSLLLLLRSLVRGHYFLFRFVFWGPEVICLKKEPYSRTERSRTRIITFVTKLWTPNLIQYFWCV